MPEFRWTLRWAATIFYCWFGYFCIIYSIYNLLGNVISTDKSLCEGWGNHQSVMSQLVCNMYIYNYIYYIGVVRMVTPCYTHQYIQLRPQVLVFAQVSGSGLCRSSRAAGPTSCRIERTTMAYCRPKWDDDLDISWHILTKWGDFWWFLMMCEGCFILTHTAHTQSDWMNFNMLLMPSWVFGALKNVWSAQHRQEMERRKAEAWKGPPKDLENWLQS